MDIEGRFPLALNIEVKTSYADAKLKCQQYNSKTLYGQLYSETAATQLKDILDSLEDVDSVWVGIEPIFNKWMAIYPPDAGPVYQELFTEAFR